MKQFISGKLFDTGKARALGGYSVTETLYLKEATDEMFLHRTEKIGDGEGHFKTEETIERICEADAKLWAMTHLTADHFIQLFGEPEE